MVPEQHPTRTSYLALPLDLVVEQPVDLRLWVDGRKTRQRAQRVPALVQVQAATGRLHQSTYLWPGEQLPPWPQPHAADDSAGSPVRLPLLITSVVAAGGSATMLILAGDSHARWEDPATPEDELDSLRARTNGLLLGSGGAALLAVGAGVGAAVAF